MAAIIIIILIAYYNRGNVYSDLGEYNTAIANYTSAIRLYPDNALAYSNRGIVKVDNQFQNSSSKTYFSR